MFPLYVRCTSCGKIFRRQNTSGSGKRSTYRVRCQYCDSAFYLWEEDARIYTKKSDGSYVEVTDEDNIKKRKEYMKKKAQKILA